MSNVKVIDKGYKSIIKNMALAKNKHVAVGILDSEIAEYASFNEFGTRNIPSRPFMATAFDEGKQKIAKDIELEVLKLTNGSKTAEQSLTIIGQKHAQRIQNTISGRNFLPALSPATVKGKKGSTKTLIDTGAMINSVRISIRGG